MRRARLSPLGLVVPVALLVVAGRVSAQTAPKGPAISPPGDVPLAPARRPPTRPHRKPTRGEGPVASAPGFEQLDDGRSRLYVDLSSRVDVGEQAAAGSIAFLLRGARVVLGNDQNPLYLRYFNTPVAVARLRNEKAGAVLLLQLRGDAKHAFALVDRGDAGVRLEVTFERGAFADSPAPPAAPPARPPPPPPGPVIHRSPVTSSQGSTRPQAEADVSASVSTGQPPAEPQPEGGETSADGKAPLAPATGFQAALRAGYALPIGSAISGEKMSDAFAGQFALLADLGFKASENVFVGAYGGVSFGKSAAVAGDCASAQVTCSIVGWRIGGEVQYHFIPAGRVNPWVGVGIGYEQQRQSGSGVPVGETSSHTFSSTLGGAEFVASAGLDLRLSSAFGLGPFVDLSAGEYSSASATIDGITTTGDVAKAWHEWLIVGARVVLFP